MLRRHLKRELLVVMEEINDEKNISVFTLLFPIRAVRFGGGHKWFLFMV